MANDITKTDEQPAAQLVTDATEALFSDSTGYTRTRATRTVNAVLTVIGATMNDNLEPRAQFGGAVNILGMGIAEVIAGSGANKQQREELITTIAAFITKTSDELAAHYAELAQLLNANQQGPSN